MTLLKAYSENKETQVEFTRTISRLQGQKLGQYEFNQLYEEVDELQPPYLDHASYIRPVEVRHTKERGRGIFTTALVKAGDLLLAEKGFAYSYRESEEEALRSGSRHSKASMLIYQETNTVKAGSEASSIKTVVQKLFKNRSLVLTFTDLYHGEYPSGTSREIDGLPAIET